MITEEKYNELLNSGLSLDHYYLLVNLRDDITPVLNKRVQGFINLLNKRGYIKDDKLTDKAIELIGTVTQEEVKKVSEVYTNYEKWVKDLHESCQDLLVDLTGKKQVSDKINGKGTSYMFLPNPRDLSTRISKVIAIYKLKDLEKIKAVILAFIIKRYDERSWFPLLKYYIHKDSESQMVTDVENELEEKVVYKSSQKLM